VKFAIALSVDEAAIYGLMVENVVFARGVAKVLFCVPDERARLSAEE